MYFVILDISRILDVFCGGIYLQRHLAIVTERFCYYYIESIQRQKWLLYGGRSVYVFEFHIPLHCVCLSYREQNEDNLLFHFHLE